MQSFFFRVLQFIAVLLLGGKSYVSWRTWLISLSVHLHVAELKSCSGMKSNLKENTTSVWKNAIRFIVVS